MDLERLYKAVAKLPNPYFDDGGGRLIYHGDCLKLLPLIESGSVDAIVTDPPYGMDLQPQRGKVKAIAGDVRRDAKAILWSSTPQFSRILTNDSASLFFGRWSEEWAKSVLEEWFTVKACIAWVKNQWDWILRSPAMGIGVVRPQGRAARSGRSHVRRMGLPQGS